MKNIKKGKYRHFKGGEYEVLGVATHSETLETLVVYKPLYGDMNTWVRPIEMFFDKKEHEGKQLARFTYIGE